MAESRFPDKLTACEFQKLLILKTILIFLLTSAKRFSSEIMTV